VRVVLIAAKQLALAKTRLAPVLPPIERSALAEAMFRDVLGAALGAVGADRVAVVSSDPRILGTAQDAGAVTIDERYPRGLNAAVRLATDALIAQGADAVCTVLADIPLVTSADIDVALAELAGPAGVALVPSRDLSGTNIIGRAPADVIPTRFGHLSLARHFDECRRLGVPCRVVRLDGPALDLDLMEDLIQFMRTPTMTHTFNQLTRLGIAHG
jgi:2-phospho-L-lactate/phosphoenolpyruvate guanylyltransferase